MTSIFQEESVERSGAIHRASVDIFDEIGSTGLRRTGGIVDDEFLPQLQGRQARRVWREMGENDSVAGAGLLAYDLLMRQVSWSLRPADDSPQAAEVADFVQSCLHDMSATWDDTLSAIFTQNQYGFAWCEEVYKHRNGYSADPKKPSSNHDDGRVGWANLALRNQDTLCRWEFVEETGDVESFVQQVPGESPKPIPAAKSLHFRTSASRGNPEGRSLMRIAYRDWYWKRRIMEIEGIGIERDLAGLPVMKVPERLLSANATENDRKLLARLREMVTQVRRNEAEGLVLPHAYDNDGRELYEFSLLSTGGSRQFDTAGILTRYDSRIAMSLLVDVLLMGHEKVGTQALGATKVDLFAAALGALLDGVAAEFESVAFPRLLRYNGLPLDLLPKLEHGEVQRIDLAELGALLTAMSGAGAPLFGDDPERRLESHMLELARLPTPPETPGEL